MGVLKVLQALKIILRDLIENDGKTLISVVMGVISILFALLFFFLMPVVIHERVPVASLEQAVSYHDIARQVSDMTQSPCDPGVEIDWQEMMAVDAVRYEQNFEKADPGSIKRLANMFIEESGICKVCEGEGEEKT